MSHVEPHDIEEFLAQYPPEVAALGAKLRAFVGSNAAQSSETLHTGWRVISYGYKKKFCAIAPHANWVNLQFHKGSALEDPTLLLQGAGKSMRHVKISDAGQLHGPLAKLIQQAGRLAQ